VNYTNAIEVWTCQLGGLAEYAFLVTMPPCFLFPLRTHQLGYRDGTCSPGACRLHEPPSLPGSRWITLGRGEAYVPIFLESRPIGFIGYAHRHQTRRHRQRLVEIDNKTVYHSGGAILVLRVIDI
jgi:hypothetical protein